MEKIFALVAPILIYLEIRAHKLFILLGALRHNQTVKFHRERFKFDRESGV